MSYRETGGRKQVIHVTDRPGSRPGAAPKIDTSVPNSARVWNYWLGGRDHYEVDRVAGYHFSAVFPEIVDIARADRLFLGRVARFLAADAGVRQFLDIGTGLPTEENTHEVAQRVAPDARVVYVDNDPLVLAYARALLTSSPDGATDYVDADIRDPDTVLREAQKTLDFTQPVGLTLMGILGHIADYGEARSAVAKLLDGLPSGSYLAIGDGVSTGERYERALRQYAETGAAPYYSRTVDEFTGFFEGLELVEPGVVPLPAWRSDPGAAAVPPDAPRVGHLGGVGRKVRGNRNPPVSH
jgi:S-adenosyl methyltransferase